MPFRCPRRRGWRRVQPGEAVIDYDDTSDEVFLIISGTVRIAIHSASGHEVILGEAGSGEIFGEIRPASTMVLVAGLVDRRWKVEVELDAIVEGG